MCCINDKTELNYYHDWLKFFKYLNNKNFNDQLYLIAKNGQLADSDIMLGNFKNILIEFINEYINLQFTLLIKKINSSFEFNDLSMINKTLFQINNNLKKLSFFKHLSFLNMDFKNELYKSLTDNIQTFYDDIINKIKINTVENNIAFEIYYLLKKNKKQMEDNNV